jgi:hypothetical protein
VKKIDAVEGTEMTEWYSCRQGGVSFGKSWGVGPKQGEDLKEKVTGGWGQVSQRWRKRGQSLGHCVDLPRVTTQVWPEAGTQSWLHFGFCVECLWSKNDLGESIALRIKHRPGLFSIVNTLCPRSPCVICVSVCLSVHPSFHIPVWVLGLWAPYRQKVAFPLMTAWELSC